MLATVARFGQPQSWAKDAAPSFAAPAPTQGSFCGALPSSPAGMRGLGPRREGPACQAQEGFSGSLRLPRGCRHSTRAQGRCSLAAGQPLRPLRRSCGTALAGQGPRPALLRPSQPGPGCAGAAGAFAGAQLGLPARLMTQLAALGGGSRRFADIKRRLAAKYTLFLGGRPAPLGLLGNATKAGGGIRRGKHRGSMGTAALEGPLPERAFPRPRASQRGAAN